MNYYYDLIINLRENNEYVFYEWLNTDDLLCIKKIPIIKVNSKDMLDILLNQIKIDEDTLLFIQNKTIIDDTLNSKLNYSAIFSDGDYAIMLEFKDNGKVIRRSRLLLEDENNVNEIVMNTKEKKITYDILKKLDFNNELRQASSLKNNIRKEINKLYDNKEVIKLKYLFLEWFNYEEQDINKIIKIMNDDLNNELNSIHENIYYLIKLSYSKV